jgi:hypothetical protein
LSWLSRSLRQGSRRVPPSQASVGSLISGPMAQRSSISRKPDRHQPLLAILILSLENMSIYADFSRERPSRPGDHDGENVAVVRPVDEVLADYATPCGSSPPMRPISSKLQRTASSHAAIWTRTREEPRQTRTGRANCRRRRCERLRCNIKVSGSTTCFASAVLCGTALREF